MKNIQTLIEFATYLNLDQILIELDFVKQRIKQENKEIILPVIGEFSSGKTTLLNALSSNNKLETASEPTTSVIYEIYFGQDSEYAEIYYDDGTTTKVENISDIKNDQLENVSLIKIRDISTKVPNNTILVDTPGLSSNESKHLENLSRYLPSSDALLLCVDANQQVTNTLLNFIKDFKLAYLPIYIIITKSDTKTANEINEIKTYISKNIQLPIENIISISSQSNRLDEFYGLMDSIQKNKNDIINNVLNYRLDGIAEYLKKYLEDLIKNSSTDKAIEKKLKSQEIELKRMSNSISRLIEDTRSNLKDAEYETIKKFEQDVSEKLDSCIAQRKHDMDIQARNIINSSSNIVLANYQNEVSKNLYFLANERKNTDLGIPLRSLESIDFSGFQLQPLNYNIDLASAGQDQVKNISLGLKVAAAIGVAAVAAAAIAAAAPAAASAATGATAVGAETIAAAGTISTIANVADTATDVASIASNRSLARKVVDFSSKVNKHIPEIQKNMGSIDEYNAKASQMITPEDSQGFVEKIVNSVGDSQLGRPQRRKIISDFLESSLLPEFKVNIQGITNSLLINIKTNLELEAQIVITELENNLKDLQNLSTNSVEEYNKKMQQYNSYIEVLSN